jgi:peptide-methionine (S)-S-oxide reductase
MTAVPSQALSALALLLAAIAIPGVLAMSALRSTDSPSPADTEKLATASAIPQPAAPDAAPAEKALATFGSGCFWCTEAVFQQLKGVERVVSGYSGGTSQNPSYEDICTGATGHAEVIQVTYDPRVVGYDALLEVFWKTHDPTTLNRQGNDVGTQYRSVVFYHDDEQRRLAEHYKEKLDAARIFRGPIVTEISPLTKFHPAENYHQNYFEDNSRQPYCSFVIRPKLEKLRQVFADKLKE